LQAKNAAARVIPKTIFFICIDLRIRLVDL
jgi:hypothetical protein